MSPRKGAWLAQSRFKTETVVEGDAAHTNKMREFRVKRPTPVKENEALFIFEFVRLAGATQDSLAAFCRGELFVLVAGRPLHPRDRCSQGAWTKPIEGARFAGGDHLRPLLRPRGIPRGIRRLHPIDHAANER